MTASSVLVTGATGTVGPSLFVDRGALSARYLAMGPPDDACSLASFSHQFLRLAGIPHVVEDIDPQRLGAGDDREFGSMARMVRTGYPDVPHDCSRTTEELGYAPTPLATGLQVTLDWLRRHDRLAVTP